MPQSNRNKPYLTYRNASRALREANRARQSDPKIFWVVVVVLALVVAGFFVLTKVTEKKDMPTGDVSGISESLQNCMTEPGGLERGRIERGYWYDGSCGYNDTQNARLALAQLPVREKDTASYKRVEQFGDFGFDFDNSGCSTREDIRILDMVSVSAKGCKVQRGVLPYDRYTGQKNVHWDRKHGSKLQVEHIVALEDVCFSGACDRWGNDPELDGLAKKNGVDTDVKTRRLEIANDPLNLILVSGPENQSKGSKDASKWMVPGNAEFRCEYVTRQALVKYKYGLSVTASEKKAMDDQLRRC